MPWSWLLALVEFHYLMMDGKSVRSTMNFVHGLDMTAVKVHVGRIWDGLLHRDEASVWADNSFEW